MSAFLYVKISTLNTKKSVQPDCLANPPHKRDNVIYCQNIAHSRYLLHTRYE